MSRQSLRLLRRTILLREPCALLSTQWLLCTAFDTSIMSMPGQVFTGKCHVASAAFSSGGQEAEALDMHACL